MNYFTKRQRSRRRIAFLRQAAILAVIFLLLHLLDKPLYLLIESRGLGHDGKERIEGKDWYDLLHITGSLLTWAVICSAIVLHDRRVVFARKAWRVYRRGVLIFASAVAGGIVTELGKVLIARERPSNHGGDYHFRPIFSSLLDSGGLGLPSSHAGVAFGGAAMLAMFMPGAGVIAMALAVGCAISRMLTSAHFLTDVFLGAVLAMWTAKLLYRAFGPDRGPDGSVANARARLG